LRRIAETIIEDNDQIEVLITVSDTEALHLQRGGEALPIESAEAKADMAGQGSTDIAIVEVYRNFDIVLRCPACESLNINENAPSACPDCGHLVLYPEIRYPEEEDCKENEQEAPANLSAVTLRQAFRLF
jgi:hypothetical protein